MAVFDLYSKRKKAAQADIDVFQYETLPAKLRVQILHILNDALGPYYHASEWSTRTPPNNNDVWGFIHETLCREKGVAELCRAKGPKEEIQSYLQHTDNIDDALDVIELSFRCIDRVVGKFDIYQIRNHGIKQSPQDAITELNIRFRENAVGYQFEGGSIIQLSSELIHSEVVKPALHFLSDARFNGAQVEFLNAHEHFRDGRHKEAIALALNAFESTLKCICDIKGWEVNKGARASDLLKVLRSNGYFPDFLDNSFDQLAATLSSGLPKVRNEQGGHGQGAKNTDVPPHIAAYALHLAAAKIVFLVSALN